MMKNQKMKKGPETTQTDLPSDIRRTLLKSGWVVPLVTVVGLPAHAQTSPVSTTTTTTTTTTTLPLPDLAAGMNVSPNPMLVGETATATYTITNVGLVPSQGAINVTISGFSFGSFTLNNLPAGWTVSESIGLSYRVITTTNVIEPGLTNQVTFSGEYQHTEAEPVVEVPQIVIEDGAGGENNSGNNRAYVILDINSP